MRLILADPIDRYFAADALPDDNNTAAVFSHNAEVHDEGRTHRGVEAIRAWKAEGKAKTAYTVEPLAVSLVGKQTHVSAKVAGNFPNSPVTLNYAFTIANDQIVDLDIRP